MDFLEMHLFKEPYANNKLLLDQISYVQMQTKYNYLQLVYCTLDAAE